MRGSVMKGLLRKAKIQRVERLTITIKVEQKKEAFEQLWDDGWTVLIANPPPMPGDGQSIRVDTSKVYIVAERTLEDE
jgi:hypothetical protein